MATPRTNSNPQFRFAYWGIGALFTFAGLSQVYLQTVMRGSTIEAARRTQRYTLPQVDTAKRGTIYSTDGKVLAGDAPTSKLAILFTKVPNSDGFFVALSKATGIPASEFQAQALLVREKLSSNGGKPPKGFSTNRVWETPLGASQCDAVAQVKKDWRADGIALVNAGQRSYPLGQDAAGIVGLVRDKAALMGLELSANPILAGRNGEGEGMVDRQGRFLPTRIEPGATERKDGTPITLTLDSTLQSIAAQAIREAVKKHNADNGVAIVLDPATGDILAMANAPTFSPYEADGSDSSLKGDVGGNASYMMALEPGSTFKVLTLAKGLDDGKVTMHDHFYCSGEMTVGKRVIHCDKHGGSRAHGALDPTLAIAKSCNLNAAVWAMKIGRQPMFDYIKSLGLLQRPKLGVPKEFAPKDPKHPGKVIETTLSLPKEARGLLRENEPAQQLQLATIGFGQSITTSPISLAGAFQMLANDGVRVPVRLVKRVGNKDMPVRPGVRIVRPETAQAVIGAMEAVFSNEHGTGRKLQIPGYLLAGKTGTAEKVGAGHGYVSNFLGFVPAVHPRAEILVMVNNPKQQGYYGAEVAGPVFVKLAEGVIRRYGLRATEPIVRKASRGKEAKD